MENKRRMTREQVKRANRSAKKIRFCTHLFFGILFTVVMLTFSHFISVKGELNEVYGRGDFTIYAIMIILIFTAIIIVILEFNFIAYLRDIDGKESLLDLILRHLMFTDDDDEDSPFDLLDD